MKLIKFLISILSYVPITSVAVAAQMKCNEIDGVLQNEKLKKQILDARKRILRKNQLKIDFQESYERYINLLKNDSESLSIDSLTLSFLKDIELLIENGHIVIDEKEIRAHGPSEHAL